MKRQHLKRMIPPYWFALSVLTLISCEYLRPFPGLKLGLIQGLLALIPATLSLALALSALHVFKQAQTTSDPFGNANTLVIRGPFRLSRNPMYLSLALLLVALSIWLGQPLGLLVTAAFIAIINRNHIRPEEQRLEQHFKDDYRRYLSQVRRWL